MTWTKLGQEFITDPTMLGVPRGARLLHVEATIYANMHGTDGAIPRHVLQRITDEPDAARAVASLVAAGLWQVDGAGWLLLDFADKQRSAEDVDRLRRRNAERQRRYRQHSLGDHSLCEPRYCRSARKGESPVDNGVTRTVTNPVSNDALICTDPIRTDPIRKDRDQVRIKEPGDPSARPDGRPTIPGGLTTVRRPGSAAARRLALLDELEGKA